MKIADSGKCFQPATPRPSEPCLPDPCLAPERDSKYYHEIGAELIGNQLLICMEKDKKKKKKKKEAWDPPCDCEVIEIKRPTSTKGPRIVNAGDNNQILFRIHSRAHLIKKDDPNYKPQAIAYKVNRSDTDQSRKITVYPQLGGPTSQEVFTEHITDANQDVYLLRVTKKSDAVDGGKRRNLEVEMRSPKPPPPPKQPTLKAAQPVQPTRKPPEKDEKPTDAKQAEKKKGGKAGKKEKKKKKKK